MRGIGLTNHHAYITRRKANRNRASVVFLQYYGAFEKLGGKKHIKSGLGLVGVQSWENMGETA